jgi:predicted cupin superfamily sugar epimerase
VSAPYEPASIIEHLELERLEGCEGLYSRTLDDGYSLLAYVLIVAPQVYPLRRAASPELFHFYAGAPAKMLLLVDGGDVAEPMLGVNVVAGERPVASVPARTWRGAESLGAWTLLGAAVAPGFSPELTSAPAETLVARWPNVASRITRLAASRRVSGAA